ncbi:MAG: hypothetical protein RQ783_05580, partial [Gammaproteobacteria bacterium]|nr:hypothetical protein [Gammaproteobacteria bacterium]
TPVQKTLELKKWLNVTSLKLDHYTMLGIQDWNANTGYVYSNFGWYKIPGYDVHSLKSGRNKVSTYL